MAQSDWQWPRPRPITSIQNSMGICVVICLCAVWTPPHISIELNHIGLGLGLGHCQSDWAIRERAVFGMPRNVSTRPFLFTSIFTCRETVVLFCRGTEEHLGIDGSVDIINSTLGKALGGAAGGYTAGPKELIDLLRNRSRPYLFSNTLPPPVVACANKVNITWRRWHADPWGHWWANNKLNKAARTFHKTPVPSLTRLILNEPENVFLHIPWLVLSLFNMNWMRSYCVAYPKR